MLEKAVPAAIAREVIQVSSANNNWNGIGNLGGDPELRSTNSGQSVCNFSVAIDDEFSDRTSWIPVVVWGKLGEVCKKHLQKGSGIAIQGRLQTRVYVDKEGIQRPAFEIVASSIKFLSKIKSEDKVPVPTETAADQPM